MTTQNMAMNVDPEGDGAVGLSAEAGEPARTLSGPMGEGMASVRGELTALLARAAGASGTAAHGDGQAKTLGGAQPTQKDHYRAMAGKAARMEREGRYGAARQHWQAAATLAMQGTERHWCESRAQWCERRVGGAM